MKLSPLLRNLSIAIGLVFIAVPVDAASILITGSNRGIGLGLAERYAEMGWTVYATARTPARADELNALAENYDNLTVDELDVTDDAEIEALAKKLEGKPIDVLINNAGILGDITKQNAQNIDYDEIKAIMDVNVYGPMKMTKAFLPHVKASEQKKILTMTSGLGVHDPDSTARSVLRLSHVQSGGEHGHARHACRP